MLSSQQRKGGKDPAFGNGNQDKIGREGCNATTVVSVKDIDKRLLNLMKSMGN